MRYRTLLKRTLCMCCETLQETSLLLPESDCLLPHCGGTALVPQSWVPLLPANHSLLLAQCHPTCLLAHYLPSAS